MKLLRKFGKITHAAQISKKYRKRSIARLMISSKKQKTKIITKPRFLYKRKSEELFLEEPSTENIMESPFQQTAFSTMLLTELEF
jgi:hypothetical protein